MEEHNYVVALVTENGVLQLFVERKELSADMHALSRFPAKRRKHTPALSARATNYMNNGKCNS
jgi:hypothetical protein